MGHKLPPNQLALYKKIDEILLNAWDPCGISGIPEANDEYRSYLPQVFKLALDGGSPSDIAKYLLSVERDRMGLSAANNQQCEKIAAMVLEAKKLCGV